MQIAAGEGTSNSQGEPPPYPSNSQPKGSVPLSHLPRGRGRGGRGRGRGGSISFPSPLKVLPLPHGVIPSPRHQAMDGLQKCHKLLSALLRLSVCLTTNKQKAVNTILQEMLVSHDTFKFIMGLYENMKTFIFLKMIKHF